MFAPLQMAGAAPSSGRAGGLFKSASHRTSVSTPYRSSGTWNYSRQPHSALLGSPRFIVHGATGWHYGSAGAVAARRTLTITEMTVLVTVIAILIQGVINNNKRDMMAGPLGAGTTVVTLTVAMNVSDRRDPNSIMKRLRKLSLAADTSNRKGVQDLISEVSLELLRQEKSIVSASAKAKHFHNPEFAERQFRSQSVRSRSKFDREVVNKFGDQLLTDETLVSTLSENDSDPTMAVVSINMSIEGKSLASTEVRSREDLIRALSQIAADSQVGTCLLSGEVLWSPEVPGDRITNEDLYADFPNLIPL
ncbi:hypothetical protein FisN_4Lh397 [Fistulifera solaris]|uniref:Uncharacterized protein n=1 Tax=Fistulifera solaris TaxID=1519565 RepID=A0A1Z5JZJ8_FISSO|nr:hypothetical protein FisN_4Lh397 [Fistulifera solaris]|eukprot:GAX19417.1 hypothetical protein FisN_4Lh397 [Fistulifera solaris]